MNHASLHINAARGVCILLLLLPLTRAVAQVSEPFQGHAYKVEQVVSGLGVPWGMVVLPDGNILLTERSGVLKHLTPTSGQIKSIAAVPEVMAEGQGGLLDIALAPDYNKSGLLYFTYSKNVKGEGATALARARLAGERLEQWQDLIVTQSRSDTGRHYGSRIAFDERGHLYFSVGDRGERDNAQDRTNHAGTILRLNRDGTVPGDNPFVDDDDSLPEIWSFGHRNPQGLAYDNVHGRLWSIEHGPRGGDEINLIQAGKNYGWPVISYGKEYWGPFDVGEGTHRRGMEQPVKVYVPSIAPGSLMVYHGRAFPKWQGLLFAGALKLQHLNVITLDAQGKAVFESRLLEGMNKRIRALCQSPEGWIYLSTDTGEIYVIKPV